MKLKIIHLAVISALLLTAYYFLKIPKTHNPRHTETKIHTTTKTSDKTPKDYKKSAHITTPQPALPPQPHSEPQQSLPLMPLKQQVPEPQPIVEDKPSPPKTIDYEIQSDGLVVVFGDIVLGVPKSEKMAAHGVVAPPALKLWDTVEIPYHIQPSVKNPERIKEALDNFNSTPIIFVPYQQQTDALVFEPGAENCKSYLGKTGGLQPIWISENCDPPEIIHEIMHALGFIHEQSRTDRDLYIEILFDNIDDKYKSQFTMVPEALMSPLIGTPFDYQSVMIYHPTAFAKQNGMKTLRSKNTNEILPSNGLSKQDVERLIKVYGSKR